MDSKRRKKEKEYEKIIIEDGIGRDSVLVRVPDTNNVLYVSARIIFAIKEYGYSIRKIEHEGRKWKKIYVRGTEITVALFPYFYLDKDIPNVFIYWNC